MLDDGVSPIIKDLKDLEKQPARCAIDIKVLKDLRPFFLVREAARLQDSPSA